MLKKIMKSVFVTTMLLALYWRPSVSYPVLLGFTWSYQVLLGLMSLAIFSVWLALLNTKPQPPMESVWRREQTVNVVPTPR